MRQVCQRIRPPCFPANMPNLDLLPALVHTVIAALIIARKPLLWPPHLQKQQVQSTAFVYMQVASEKLNSCLVQCRKQAYVTSSMTTAVWIDYCNLGTIILVITMYIGSAPKENGGVDIISLVSLAQKQA